jgi:hypothetical protein
LLLLLLLLFLNFYMNVFDCNLMRLRGHVLFAYLLEMVQ